MSDRLSGLVANEHGLWMDVGDQHQSSWLRALRPARAGLLGPEDLALAREAAWILTRWWLDTTTAGADSWRCEANRVEVRRFGLTGANLPAIVPRWRWRRALLPHAPDPLALALEVACRPSAGADIVLDANRASQLRSGAAIFDRERGEAVRGADDDGSQDLAEHQVF